MGVLTTTMSWKHIALSLSALALTVSLTSAQTYRCFAANESPCECVFPFKYNGVTHNTCTYGDETDLWCATGTNANGEYDGGDQYGWCLPEVETETEPEPVDPCAGQCERPNQRCEVESGQAVCRCLEGYLDGQSGDGSQCQCVRDWEAGAQSQTRGHICNSCPRGFELKTWQQETTNKKKQWCHKEARECSPDRDEENEHYPNIERIGRGYNIIIGNLLELPARDTLGHQGFRNLHKNIFNPYSVDIDDSRDQCKVNGYIMDRSKNCAASLKTKIFSNSRQVMETIAEKVQTGRTVEEFTFSVSEGENAQFSNSVSFGSSFTQSSDSTTGSSSNHCVDESTSESTERGRTVEKSKTAEKSSSYEQTQSQSQSTERSNSDTQTSSTSKEQSSSSTDEVNGSAIVGGSAFGFTASATAGFSKSNTKSNSRTDTNEKSSTNSLTSGSEKSSGYTRNNANSDSSTNSEGFTDTASKQKSITTNICNEGSESSSNHNGLENSRDTSNERNTGTTFDKSFEIPGDSRSVSHSKAVTDTEEFFQEFSGSISHTEASCVKYTASLNDNSPPAFSSDFKDIIREMDTLTEELWDSNIETKKLTNGTLISRKNEKNEKKFDALFSKFIENFGTHYIQKAVMGGMQRISNKIKSLKEDTGNKEQVENCLNKAIKEKRGDQSVQDGTSNDNCNNEGIENRVKSALETREEDLQTYGGGAGEDIYQWTTNQFLSPTLLPDFKLQPIVKLFRPEFMNSKRVTRADGTAINHKRILSWLMPRYAILIGRCRLMKNHHVSEGKTCLPNKPYLVSTRDALEATHLADLCQSLPDHILEPGATDCVWCPGGVDHSRRACKPDYLNLYQQWEKEKF